MNMPWGHDYSEVAVELTPEATAEQIGRTEAPVPADTSLGRC